MAKFFRAFLIPNNGSMRITPKRPSLRALAPLVNKDLSEMMKETSAVEIVYVNSSRVAVENRMVRKAQVIDVVPVGA